MNNAIVNAEIKKCNQKLIAYVRSHLSEAYNSKITDREIIGLVPDSEYKAFIEGWMLAKDFDVINIDSSKQVNANNL